MKCLAVQQPFAHLLGSGAKRIENRTWGTSYRGPVLIHASKAQPSRECLDRWFNLPVTLPLGAIVAVVELVDVVRPGGYRRHEFERDPHAEPGFVWWVFEQARALTEPIPMQGRLGLYDVPDQVLTEEVLSCLPTR